MPRPSGRVRTASGRVARDETGEDDGDVLAEGLTAPILAALQRPDLRVVADGRTVRFDLREPRA